ncbi:MAG TPA: peptidoglycan DD-metalloendopeptidase family protein [bacterium]|nr:peptidoglycan DD-metalloendopeptidase family protein [bacterium]
MAFTIKRPSSRRFFQLSFEGFRPSGRNKIEQYFRLWLDFFRSLGLYIVKKIYLLGLLLTNIVKFIIKIPSQLKNFLTKKMIWSRGKLGRTIATWLIMGFSFLVFSLGEIFSSSPLVVNKPVSADYLKSETDIIPKKEVALTSLSEERKRDQPVAYTIQQGDTLYSIGNQFKVSIDAIKYTNGLSDSAVLSVGKEIIIPPASGLIHKVESGDTLNSIANEYDVPAQAIADFNYILDTGKLAVGTELVIPGGKIPVVVPVLPVYVSQPSQGGASGASPDKGFCVWPTTVWIITQYYSWYHNGVDIAASRQAAMPPILACDSGTVTRSGWDPFGLGLHVIIDHGDGYQTVYGHMSRLDVSYGEKVSRGEQIGVMGSTGRSTGPHVHFMVKYNGAAQNPLDYTQ